MTEPATNRGQIRPLFVAGSSGVLAAGAALGTGEAVSGLSERIPSLVVAVANVLVDETPGGIVRWSIDTFGASQKTVLVTGVVIVSLLVGGLLGLAARRDFATGAAGFAGFGLIGGWAAARGTLSSDVASWLSAMLSTGVGIAALRTLLGPPPGFIPADSALSRRWFLSTSGAAAFWGATGAAFGSALRRARNVEGARQELAAELGPSPPSAAALVPAGVETFDELAGIAPLVTPNRDFYRIDTALLSPQVDPAGWRLRITGMVDDEVELAFDELLAMERIEEFVTLSCVSNEVGGDLVGNALWSGVILSDLLDRAGVQDGATQIVGRAVDGWTAGFPTEVAYDGRPCLVAVTMNGEPLPVAHGFPARLVVPGLYGYVSATKWLTEIELTTLEAFDAYWVPRGWAKEAPVKTQSRIDVPRHGSAVAAGRVAVAGVAWAPTRTIARVEVRVDDGPWRDARLSGELSDHAWVQWVHDWDAEPGSHRLRVRATDGTGETQTGEIAPPAPDGATGHHTIRVEVR
ncbi:MAG: molybdopterin-dependent oxidoreductase [Acidimicrobiales bacterium]